MDQQPTASHTGVANLASDTAKYIISGLSFSQQHDKFTNRIDHIAEIVIAKLTGQIGADVGLMLKAALRSKACHLIAKSKPWWPPGYLSVEKPNE